MALLGNYSVLTKTPGRTLGGPTVSDTRANFNKSGANRNRFTAMPGLMSVPNGYRPHYSFIIAKTSGGLALYRGLIGTGTTSSVNLAGGKSADGTLAGSSLLDNTISAKGHANSALTGAGALTAANIKAIANVLGTLSGTGSVSQAEVVAFLNAIATVSGTGSIQTAALGLVVSAVGSLTGSGTISAANMASAIAAVASLTGTGTVTVNNIIGVFALTTTLHGTGTVTAALFALGNLLGSIISAGTIATTSLTAKANIEADLTPFTELSPANLAAALWNSVATEFNTAGSMGYKLNAAGNASDPWASPDALTVAQIVTGLLNSLPYNSVISNSLGVILKELHQLQGLDTNNPLAVTSTSREVGNIAQTITDAAGTVTVERQ